MSEVDITELAAASAEGAMVLDVREPHEYLAGHVPGALLIPLRELTGRLEELPRDHRLHVICASGNRSLHAARWLASAGYDAVSVAGGTNAWAEAGRPIVTGAREDAA